MKSRAIGDIDVSAIALGTASLVIDESVAAEQVTATIDAAVEAGVSLIDTAAAYASSTDLRAGERIVAAALRRHPQLVVATKGGHTREADGWQVDGRPDAILADCEASLRVLGVDAIELYYLHKPDPAVPFLDSVGALRELFDAGKIRRVGLSNVTASQLAEAREVVGISAVQNRFGPLDQGDVDCLRVCQKEAIAYLPYSPLGGLDASTSLGSRFPRTSRAATASGLSLQSVLLAWLLAFAPNVIPIVGARRPASIVDSALAAEVVLDDSTLAAIEADLRG